MQQLILTIALIFTSIFISRAQENNKITSGNDITVSVINALNDNGKVSFALFNEAGFIKQPIDAKSSNIENGVSSIVFSNVPKGEYAILCFHDENSNSRMDFHENGMPKESYGNSNNVILMGPPQFESSKFEVTTEDIKLEIKF